MTSTLRITQHITHRSAQARACLAGETITAGGVLHVSVRGLVTLNAMTTIRSRLAVLISGHRAACVDYSRSLLAITDQGLDELYRTAASRQSVQVMAWVVPDAETAVLWRKQATRFALHGLSRFATHRPVEARDWAQDQARTLPLHQALR